MLASVSALASLTKLEEIDLSYNQLESLDLAIFAKINRLRWISLSNNRLKNFNIGYILNTVNLEYLDIAYNNLGNIPLKGNFPQLLELHIGGNNLTELSPNIQQNAPRLKKLGLNDNNWNCDYLNDLLLEIPLDKQNRFGNRTSIRIAGV